MCLFGCLFASFFKSYYVNCNFATFPLEKKKVPVAGTSPKESEKKVSESLCKKNISQEDEESRKIVSSEHVVNITGHRGINFLNDYDEAEEEELR